MFGDRTQEEVEHQRADQLLSQGHHRQITHPSGGDLFCQPAPETVEQAGEIALVQCLHQRITRTGEDVGEHGRQHPRFPLQDAALLSRLFPGHAGLRTRLAGSVLFSLLAGAAVTAFLQYGTGSLSGTYWINALGVSLGMAALSMTFIGLEALIGFAGLGIGAGLMMFLGTPLSGLSSGPHWLPDGWSTFGQLLPPGASGSLLRANAYFDGTGALAPALILTAWVVLGLALNFIADRRGPRPATADASPTHTEPVAV